MGMNNETLIPTVYPALESEVYEAMEMERETIIPTAQEQMSLELECMFGDE